jgi:hypothetical protein
MDDSEAGDRAGSGHESDGTPLNSVNSNGSMAPESAPERTEARAGSAFCDEPAHTLMLSRAAVFLTCLFPSQVI